VPGALAALVAETEGVLLFAVIVPAVYLLYKVTIESTFKVTIESTLQ
jgi:hypothetical protein